MGSWNANTIDINAGYKSINCTSVPGWETLTADNFSWQCTSMYYDAEGFNDKNTLTPYIYSPKISYNNATGIVTVYGLSFIKSYGDHCYLGVSMGGTVYCSYIE